MIRRLLATGGAAALSVLTLRAVARRGAVRLLGPAPVGPGEAALRPALDALGGEVVRLRARDGVRLAGRWLPPQGADATWRADPHDAIVLLHGYSGSITPDLVEYGPFLRATAGVLGLDFRGHGESDPGPSTFGALEVEDVAGALAWLGERGVTRVALVGTSMGAIAAIASVAVLGDGSLAAADAVDDRTEAPLEPARPAIVAVVADSAAPEVEIPVASRLPGVGRRFVAGRLFDAAARIVGFDPRATEPIRVIDLVDPVPLLLIHGEDDDTVPLADARRLVAAAGPQVDHWFVPGAGHSGAHAVVGQDYERRVTDFLQVAFRRARGEDVGAPGAGPIIARRGQADTGPAMREALLED